MSFHFLFRIRLASWGRRLWVGGGGNEKRRHLRNELQRLRSFSERQRKRQTSTDRRRKERRPEVAADVVSVPSNNIVRSQDTTAILKR